MVHFHDKAPITKGIILVSFDNLRKSPFLNRKNRNLRYVRMHSSSEAIAIRFIDKKDTDIAC